MMNNKEKFFQLVSNQETATVARAKARQQIRSFTRISQQIALSILERLDELHWNQEKLATAMEVSLQQVNKWVKGGENFSPETLASLEAILNKSLISVQHQESVEKIS